MAETAGALRLEDLGLLCFDGLDAAAFLQGYLTTDATALDAMPRFTAMCNIKGRTVLTGYAWREGPRALLLLHRSLCAIALELLRPYLAFSKTRAADLSDAHALFGAVGLELSAPALRLDARRQVLILEPGAESAEHAGGLPSSLGSAPPLSPEQWRSAAIERREVWLQAATSGAFLPQMLALDELGAVSFAKGCYLGQEVVARAQHRGQVKRRLTRLKWSGAAPSVGAELQDGGGRRVGAVVAAAACQARGPGTAAGQELAGSALAVMARDATPPLAAGRGKTKFQRLDQRS